MSVVYLSCFKKYRFNKGVGFTPDLSKFWSFVDPRQTFRTDSTPYVSVRG